VTLSIDGLLDPPGSLLRELVGLPPSSPHRGRVRSRASTTCSSRATALKATRRAGVLRPLNAKFGQPCFSLGRIAGEEVNDFREGVHRVVNSLPARDQSARRVYGAPPGRQRLIKDPETLRRLVI
jgi:hypothetical protein